MRRLLFPVSNHWEEDHVGDPGMPYHMWHVFSREQVLNKRVVIKDSAAQMAHAQRMEYIQKAFLGTVGQLLVNSNSDP